MRIQVDFLNTFAIIEKWKIPQFVYIKIFEMLLAFATYLLLNFIFLYASYTSKDTARDAPKVTRSVYRCLRCKKKNEIKNIPLFICIVWHYSINI